MDYMEILLHEQYPNYALGERKELLLTKEVIK